MAYNKNKVILYGSVGVILALIVLSFIPASQETQISHLVLNIESIEAQMPSGEWFTITSNEIQWDLWQHVEKLIQIDQGIAGYSRIRLNIATDSMVTLSDGQEIQLSVPSPPIEITIEPDYNEWTGLKLVLSQGTLSNYLLPNLQIELSTHKLTGEIVDQ